MKRFTLLKSLCCSSLLLLSINTFADKPPMSDSAITSNIQSKISQDKYLQTSKTNIAINTDHQVVSISGVVSSESEASTLVEIAQSTIDVKDVDTSKLMVKDSKQPLTDTFTTAKVKGEFLREKLFGDKPIPAWHVSVETNNGVVTLTGTADDKSQVETAIKLAQSISGVKQVKYRIKLTHDHVENDTLSNY